MRSPDFTPYIKPVCCNYRVRFPNQILFLFVYLQVNGLVARNEKLVSSVVSAGVIVASVSPICARAGATHGRTLGGGGKTLVVVVLGVVLTRQQLLAHGVVLLRNSVAFAFSYLTRFFVLL